MIIIQLPFKKKVKEDVFLGFLIFNYSFPDFMLVAIYAIGGSTVNVLVYRKGSQRK